MAANIPVQADGRHLVVHKTALKRRVALGFKGQQVCFHQRVHLEEPDWGSRGRGPSGLDLLRSPETVGPPLTWFSNQLNLF